MINTNNQMSPQMSPMESNPWTNFLKQLATPHASYDDRSNALFDAEWAAFDNPDYNPEQFEQAYSMLNPANEGGIPQDGWWDTMGGMKGLASGAQAANSLFSMYLGKQALGLGKDQLAFQKDAWQKNYDQNLKDYEERKARQALARAATGNPAEQVSV